MLDVHFDHFGWRSDNQVHPLPSSIGQEIFGLRLSLCGGHRLGPVSLPGLAAMLRSLYLRAKRPLQQQLRKMNETALERTEQSLKHQEDGRKLLQQDFLSNIYDPGFHLRREQVRSSLKVEKSLQNRRNSLQTALLVSSSFPTQDTEETEFQDTEETELNPLTTENFQTGGNFPALFSQRPH